MEDLKSIKLNKESAADLPEVPRKEDGSIDLEKIQKGKSKRNNTIVPDDIFDAYYRELPDKVENESGSWRTVSTGGKIKILGGDPEGDKDIHKKGGETLQATIKQQRTFADVISTMLCQKASTEAIEDLELNPGADNLEMIIAAAAKQASRGNVKAMEFLRDTIGQKPSDKLEANVTALTPEDKEMLERISRRLEE